MHTESAASPPSIASSHGRHRQRQHHRELANPLAAEVAPGAALYGLEHDFAAINDILNERINRVQSAIARVSPAMRVLDKVGCRNEGRREAFSLKTSRELAWRNAQRLAANSSNTAIGELGKITAGLANPPGLLTWLALR